MIKQLFLDPKNLILEANPDSRTSHRVRDSTRNTLKRARQFVVKFGLDLKSLGSCNSCSMSHEQMEEETQRISSPTKGGSQDGGRLPSHDQRERIRRSLEGMQTMKLNLERQLRRMLGETRSQDLLRDHVRRWDILMVATPEDQDFAYESRDAITDILKGVSIAGPWEIKLGERSLNRWERMLSYSSVVVILVSDSFLKDNLLKHFCANIITMSPKKKVIPVYLDQMKSRAFPEELRTLLLYYGIDARRLRPTDIVKPLVRCLPKAMAFKRNLDEIDSIRKLMLRISLQPEAY